MVDWSIRKSPISNVPPKNAWGRPSAAPRPWRVDPAYRPPIAERQKAGIIHASLGQLNRQLA
jgi:hypothetical protein